MIGQPVLETHNSSRHFVARCRISAAISYFRRSNVARLLSSDPFQTKKVVGDRYSRTIVNISPPRDIISRLLLPRRLLYPGNSFHFLLAALAA